MSSETLERILNVTLSESILDSAPPVTQATPMPPRAVFTACETNAINSDCTTIEPSLKRLKPAESKELFPSEHDIDNFLDQIHQ
jgi:hypothetical protein